MRKGFSELPSFLSKSSPGGVYGRSGERERREGLDVLRSNVKQVNSHGGFYSCKAAKALILGSTK
jgi:hypothetical protein